jgi:GxxExxY protein
MSGTPYLYSEITSRIIRAYFNVYNELGYGFPEKIYKRGLLLELKSEGFDARSEVTLPVWFRDCVIGRFRADIVVNGLIIVELKALPRVFPSQATQLLNYLKSTKREIGLLLNFGRKPQIKRIILTEDRRTSKKRQETIERRESV